MADLFSSTCPATVDLFLDETFLVVRPDVRGIHEVLKTDTYELVAVPKKNGRGVVRKKMKRVARMFDIYEEHEVKHLRSMHQGFPHNKSCVYVETGVKHLRTHHGFIRDVIAKLDELKIAWQLHDGRMAFPAPQLELMHGFRFSQEDLLAMALKQNTSGLIGAPTRWGKCLDGDTPVLMFDGSVKAARDVTNGDLVMGHDSCARRVIGSVRGFDIMYRIVPNKGEAFTVTQDHKLVVKRTSQGQTMRKSKSKSRDYKIVSRKSPNLDKKEFLVTPVEWETASKTFKHLHKLVRRSVEFKSQPTAVDPYCMGLWLGDGTTARPYLTTMDKECVKAWRTEAARHDLRIREVEIPNNKASVYCMSGYALGHAWSSRPERGNIWLSAIREATVSGIKRIPKSFLINDRSVRLALLAGLIDSDGNVNGRINTGAAVMEITGKNKELMDDVAFLAGSLGFRVTRRSKLKSAHAKHVALYREVTIGGDLHTIPVRLKRKKVAKSKGVKPNPLTTGFTVQRLGMGEYFGFELEGTDGVFLLGDFTATHNTTLLLNTIRAFPGLRTVVAVPGVDLVDQTYRDLKAKLEDRDVRMVHGAVTVKDQGPDVTVCSFDSLDKMDTAMTRLLLVDEPHACVTDTRTDKIIAFDRARKYGYGATLEGRFDGRDPLIKGILGPVLAERTYREAVAEGAIAPIVIIAVNIPVAHSNAYNRDIAYKIALWENETVLNILRWLLPLKDGSSHVFPAEWQRLAFISNEKQLEFIKSRLSGDVDFVTAMAKQMTGKERKERMERLKTSQDTVCFATHIYAQGVTFSDLRVMINLEGGGASTKALQKPGRVAELRPGKKCGVVVDFNFYATPAQYAAHPDSQMWALTRESRARLNAYAEKGFEIRHINNTTELVAATRDLI